MQIRFDQHFLENKYILNKEIQILNVNYNKDIILEIGPGIGALTELILKQNPKNLISIEMDALLENNLKILKSKNLNFEYIIGNALNEIKRLKFNKLISNIPYSITEPLYKYLMKEKIEFIILLQGEKFYKQILNKSSKWHYFVNAFYEVNLIEEIDGSNFNPKTKVKSVLLKLQLKTKISNIDNFFQQLFLRQNRNTKNALIYSLVEIGKTKNESKKIINEIFLQLNLKNRIIEMKLKNITNKAFINIIEELKKQIKN